MEKDNVIPFLILLYRAAGRSENLEGQAAINGTVFAFDSAKRRGKGQSALIGLEIVWYTVGFEIEWLQKLQNLPTDSFKMMAENNQILNFLLMVLCIMEAIYTLFPGIVSTAKITLLGKKLKSAAV
jgi:hypothetical protein